jgi:phospholipid/cholesterol/gamma-HCH transport system ATP-binding protein
MTTEAAGSPGRAVREVGTVRPAQTVIDVADLVTHYGTRRILNGITLAVAEGEIVVIMGGSGSGKSTLLRHLLGLEQATSGTIRILGNDLAALGAEALLALRKKIGVAFQGGALFSSLTVGENISLPLREHTRLDERTMGIMTRLKLEVVGLAGFENLTPSELSGGMIKRAAFARAIILDPKLLFCDEPSAGLDPVVSAAIDDLILKLRSALGMTIVVVTHELSSAFNIADRIAVLDRGDLLMVGTVDEVRRSDNARIQHLLNRHFEDEPVDPDEYLRRLTGDTVTTGGSRP